MIDNVKKIVVCDYCDKQIKYLKMNDLFCDFHEGGLDKTSDSPVCISYIGRLQHWDCPGDIFTLHKCNDVLIYHQACFKLFAGKEFLKNCKKRT